MNPSLGGFGLSILEGIQAVLNKDEISRSEWN